MTQGTPEQDSTPVTHSELSPEQQAIEFSGYIENALAQIHGALIDIANMNVGTHVEFTGGDSKEARLRLTTAQVQLLQSISTLESILEMSDPGGLLGVNTKARSIAERALRLAAKEYAKSSSSADTEVEGLRLAPTPIDAYEAWKSMSVDMRSLHVELDRRGDTAVSPELREAIGEHALREILDSVDTLSDLER